MFARMYNQVNHRFASGTTYTGSYWLYHGIISVVWTHIVCTWYHGIIISVLPRNHISHVQRHRIRCTTESYRMYHGIISDVPRNYIDCRKEYNVTLIRTLVGCFWVCGIEWCMFVIRLRTYMTVPLIPSELWYLQSQAQKTLFNNTVT